MQWVVGLIRLFEGFRGSLEAAISTVTCMGSLDRWHQNGNGKGGAGKTAVRGRAGVTDQMEAWLRFARPV